MEETTHPQKKNFNMQSDSNRFLVLHCDRFFSLSTWWGCPKVWRVKKSTLTFVEQRLDQPFIDIYILFMLTLMVEANNFAKQPNYRTHNYLYMIMW